MFFAILAHLEEIYWQKVKLAKSSWLSNSSVFPGVAKFLTPDNIFSKLTHSGRGGWVSERIERSIKEPYVFAYAHRRRISIRLYQDNIKKWDF